MCSRRARSRGLPRSAVHAERFGPALSIAVSALIDSLRFPCLARARGHGTSLPVGAGFRPILDQVPAPLDDQVQLVFEDMPECRRVITPDAEAEFVGSGSLTSGSRGTTPFNE